MFHARVIAAVAASLLLATALPATAQTTEPPASCGPTAPPLDEGEVYVEHTLFLHATAPAGDVAELGALVLANPPTGRPFMDTEEPTSQVSAVNAMAIPNPEFNQNALGAYWVYDLPAPQRVVCAATEFFAAGMDAAIIQLWVDQPFATQGTVTAQSTAAAVEGDGVMTLAGQFPSMDVLALGEMVFQVLPDGDADAGDVLYDSTLHPASFTYVTIERAG